MFRYQSSALHPSSLKFATRGRELRPSKSLARVAGLMILGRNHSPSPSLAPAQSMWSGRQNAALGVHGQRNWV
jgi:hypothetical protein